MIIKSIFFDFDNTIVDDYSFIIDCFRKTFFKLGIDISVSDISYSIGKPQQEIILGFLKKEEDLKDAMRIFNYYYSVNYKSEIKLFPGILKLLQDLSSKYRLALITGAPANRVYIVSEHLHIKDFFSSIITQDDVVLSKPNPEGILKTLKKLELNKNEIIYIGDANEDIDISQNIDIKFIKASWGDKRSFDNKKYYKYTEAQDPLSILDLIKNNKIL